MLNALKDVATSIKTIIWPQPQGPEDPDEPFAMVGAHVRPRTPLNRSSIALDLPKTD